MRDRGLILVCDGAELSVQGNSSVNFLSAMVEIYLSDNGAQISFVKRLAIRPFKWLRFIMFWFVATCLQRQMNLQSTTTLTSHRLLMPHTTTRPGVSFFLHSRLFIIPISKGIYLRGPQLFTRANDFYCAHGTLPRFQNGCHATRWGVLRRHRR